MAEITRASQVVLPMLVLDSLVVVASELVSAPLHVANDGDALDDVEIEVRFADTSSLEGVAEPLALDTSELPTDDGGWEPVSHLHIEFTPFHRTASRLKHLAGSELGGGAFLNDVAPERAAAELRRAAAE